MLFSIQSRADQVAALSVYIQCIARLVPGTPERPVLCMMNVLAIGCQHWLIHRPSKPSCSTSSERLQQLIGCRLGEEAMKVQ